MRIVIAVDRSDPTFALVHAIIRLYAPAKLILVHAVDHGLRRHPSMTQSVGQEIAEELLESGRKFLEQAANSVPAELSSVTKLVCELGNAARVVINVAQTEAADLIVIGSRGLSREETEFTVGSVSHRIASNAPCSTLVIKRAPEQIRRVLVSIKGPDDAAQIQRWLLANPFRTPVEVTVLHAVPTLKAYIEDSALAHHDRWHEDLHEDSVGWGHTFVNNVAAALNDTSAGRNYKAHGQVASGDPPELIIQEAAQRDLVIVASHGFMSTVRFVFGSVAEIVLYRAPGPVLVVG